MLKNKEFYIKLKEEEFKVELIKFSDTLNKALVFIPEKNVLEDVYVNELIIKDKGEINMKRKVLPLSDEEKLEYCNMHSDCIDCCGSLVDCPMTSGELTDEQIDEIRMELIKRKEIK